MLVLRPGALGDTLLSLPALRALRRRFGTVTLAGHAGAARLLAALGEVDAGLAFDDPSLGWVFRDEVPPEPVVAWMNPEMAPALRHAVLVAPSRPTTDQHCAAYLLETLAPLGVDGNLDASPLRVRGVVSEEVLVHPGSGSSRKNWPAAQFAATIAALEAPVRLIVGEADEEPARVVETALGRPVPRLQHASIEELAAHLAGCRAYLGNDSGVSHLAGLCGTPTIVLFGPTSPTVWHPLGPHIVIEPFGVEVPTLVRALRASILTRGTRD